LKGYSGRYDFVIITPGRSGSEHLSETLHNHPDIQMDGEIFNRSNESSNGLRSFVRSNHTRRALSYVFNRERLSRYPVNLPLQRLIDDFLIARHTSAKAFKSGFKITLDQLYAYPYLFKYIKQNNIRIIYLTRKDLLAVVLSLLQARKTGIYINREDIPAMGGEPVLFNVNKVQALYHTIADQQKRLYEYMKHMTCLHIYYEELFSHYRSHLTNIQRFLELSVIRELPQSTIKKIHPANLSLWVKNLDEIITILGLDRGKNS